MNILLFIKHWFFSTFSKQNIVTNGYLAFFSESALCTILENVSGNEQLLSLSCNSVRWYPQLSAIIRKWRRFCPCLRCRPFSPHIPSLQSDRHPNLIPLLFMVKLINKINILQPAVD